MLGRGRGLAWSHWHYPGRGTRTLPTFAWWGMENNWMLSIVDTAPARKSDFCYLPLLEHTTCFQGVVWDHWCLTRVGGYCQKGFLLLYLPFPDPLVRGNKLFSKSSPSPSLGYSRLVISAVPFLGYMAGNKEKSLLYHSSSTKVSRQSVFF